MSLSIGTLKILVFPGICCETQLWAVNWKTTEMLSDSDSKEFASQGEDVFALCFVCSALQLGQKKMHKSNTSTQHTKERHWSKAFSETWEDTDMTGRDTTISPDKICLDNWSDICSPSSLCCYSFVCLNIDGRQINTVISRTVKKSYDNLQGSVSQFLSLQLFNSLKINYIEWMACKCR